MMLAIFIFLISILILSSNIRIHIKSMNDTMKIYMKIGMFYVLIPHHKIFSKLFMNKKMDLSTVKKDMVKGKKLAFNIFSHSILDYIYIAKFSKRKLSKNPIENGMYLILTTQLRGLLQSRFRLVNDNALRLQYNEYYENIDYYLEAHISIINLICASIKTIFKR